MTNSRYVYIVIVVGAVESVDNRHWPYLLDQARVRSGIGWVPGPRLHGMNVWTTQAGFGPGLAGRLSHLYIGRKLGLLVQVGVQIVALFVRKARISGACPQRASFIHTLLPLIHSLDVARPVRQHQMWGRSHAVGSLQAVRLGYLIQADLEIVQVPVQLREVTSQTRSKQSQLMARIVPGLAPGFIQHAGG